MTVYRLYLGSKSTGVIVASDDKYPNMYRVHWPDRPPSDIVNLTRAKDAAMRYAARKAGGSRPGLNWKAAKSPSAGPPVRS